MGEEQTIDLQKMAQIALANKKRLLKIIGSCVLIALIAALVLPNKYTSSALIRAKPQKSVISMQAMAVGALLGESSTRPNLQGYQEIIKSRSVLDPVIAKLDLPEEEKEELTNEKFAKKYLEINNPKGSNLIEIKVTGRTAEEAQIAAQKVLESFRQTLTNLNQSEQSLQIKFLTNRIKVAKEEMEQAEQKLEEFRQQSKVFIPEEQAKSVITTLSEFDRKIAQLQVENQTNRARMQGIDNQLEQHNISLTQYNIAENTIVDKIRAAIVDKQVALVNLQQRYTDKHPDVILTKEEIKKLTASLQEEINKSIKAGTNVLNPVHGYLLQEKVIAETGAITTGAAIAAMQKAQAKIEAQISDLSANSLTYIGLERQARIAQEVYKALVINYEQARIQEAMESMDIQVVDGANLPKEPSWPKKVLFVTVGLVLGVVVSFGWLLVLYNRQERKFSQLSA